MSRSKQGSLIFQAFAAVHLQTLARLHSIVETRKHQSEASDISASEGCPPPQLWHHCLNRPGLLLSTRHSFKKKEENRPLSNLQLDTYKCCGRTDGATPRRVCFRKVPAGSPIYHDYTRMNEVTWPAEIWWNWIWVVQWLCPCLPARLFKTLWKSSGHLFHRLTFSNNLLQS